MPDFVIWQAIDHFFENGALGAGINQNGFSHVGRRGCVGSWCYRVLWCVQVYLLGLLGLLVQRWYLGNGW